MRHFRHFSYFRPMAAVDINRIPTELCSCGWHFFRKRILIKNVPGLLVGQADAQVMLFEFLVCEKCGKPHKSSMEEYQRMVPNPPSPPPALDPSSSASETSK